MASLLLVDFADELSSFLPAASIDAIRTDLGLSLAESGAVLAFLPAGGLIGNFFTWAADHVSRRALAAIGAAVYGVAMIGFGTGRSFVVLAICAFVWGAASDAFVHGAQLALADLAGDDLEPTLAGANLLGSVGSFLAPVAVVVAEATGLGWRALLIGGGIVMIGYGAWLSTQPLPRPTGAGDESPWVGVWSVLRDRAVLRIAVVNVCLDVLDFAFFGFLTLFLVDERGFSAAGAAGVVAVALAGSFVGFAVLAVTRRFLPTSVAVAVGASVHLLAIVVLLVTASPVAILLVAFGVGVSVAIWWVALQAAMLKLRPGQTGTTYAVIATLSLPSLVVPPVIGAIADRFGLTIGFALFAVFPALTLVLALLPRLRAVRRSVPKGAASAISSSDGPAPSDGAI